MHLIEYLISLLAPHLCLVCHREGDLICISCIGKALPSCQPICYRCSLPASNSSICNKCSLQTGLSAVWIATPYADTAKSLVHSLKFGRAKAAAREIGRFMSLHIPDLTGTIFVPIPTANKRVRNRGYDQAILITKSLSLATNHRIKHKELLVRLGSTRQVGSSRSKRLAQLEQSFVYKGSRPPPNSVLLVDDILTTGSTIESAAKILLNNGVETVSAVVFAHGSTVE